MSVQIKSLTNIAPTKDISLAAAVDSFNTIPTANEVYDLYSASNTSTIKKTAIVKSIRLMNTHTAATKVTLYFNRPHPTSGQNRRRLLTPADMELTAGITYLDDSELALEPGDKIQGKASVGNAIQYVISGIERDMT